MARITPAAVPDLAHLLVGQPELAEQLLKAYGIKGRAPQYVGSQYQPTLLLDSLLQPEYQWLRRWQRLHFGIKVAATAAQFSTAFLAPQANTAGQRVLAVVDGVWIGNPNAAAAEFAIQLGLPANTIAQTAGAAAYTDDDRANPFNQNGVVSAYMVSSHSNAAGAMNAGGMLVELPVGGSIYVPLGFILTNRLGFSTGNTWAALLCGATAVNTAIAASFFWRERSLLSSEAV